MKASDANEKKDAKVIEQPKKPDPRFELHGWIEGGLTGNTDASANHNFGHLFTDRANQPVLNQISIVGERALDPEY